MIQYHNLELRHYMIIEHIHPPSTNHPQQMAPVSHHLWMSSPKRTRRNRQRGAHLLTVLNAPMVSRNFLEAKPAQWALADQTARRTTHHHAAWRRTRRLHGVRKVAPEHPPSGATQRLTTAGQSRWSAGGPAPPPTLTWAEVRAGAASGTVRGAAVGRSEPQRPPSGRAGEWVLTPAPASRDSLETLGVGVRHRWLPGLGSRWRREISIFMVTTAVLYIICPVSKRHPAGVAFVGSLTSVYTAMTCQLMLCNIRLLTFVTLEGFVASVLKTMSYKITWLRERLAAVVTSEGFLTSMLHTAMRC